MIIERLRWIVAFGLIGAFCLVIVPPWKHCGYSLITSPPSDASAIDVSRLTVELALLAIACITIAMFALPQKSTITGEGQNTAKSSSHKLLAVCATFVLIVGAAFGWDAYCKYKAAELARNEMERLRSQAKAQEAQTAAAYQQMAETDAAQRRAIGDKLAKLAKPSKRSISSDLGNGVKADFYSYWKDNQLIYSVVVTGKPEPLEEILTSRPSINFCLLSLNGMPVQTFQITRRDLQPQRDKHGGISKMVTSLQSLACEMETYETLGQIKLQP